MSLKVFNSCAFIDCFKSVTYNKEKDKIYQNLHFNHFTTSVSASHFNCTDHKPLAHLGAEKKIYVS